MTCQCLFFDKAVDTNRNRMVCNQILSIIPSLSISSIKSVPARHPFLPTYYPARVRICWLVSYLLMIRMAPHHHQPTHTPEALGGPGPLVCMQSIPQISYDSNLKPPGLLLCSVPFASGAFLLLLIAFIVVPTPVSHVRQLRVTATKVTWCPRTATPHKLHLPPWTSQQRIPFARIMFFTVDIQLTWRWGDIFWTRYFILKRAKFSQG